MRVLRVAGSGGRRLLGGCVVDERAEGFGECAAGASGGGFAFEGGGFDFGVELLVGGERGVVGGEGVVFGIAAGVFDVPEGGGVDAGDGRDVLRGNFAGEDEAQQVIEAGLDAAAGIESEGEPGGFLFFEGGDFVAALEAAPDAAGVEGFLEVAAVEGAEVVSGGGAGAAALAVGADACAGSLRCAC